MFVIISTRLYIAQVVGIVGWYMTNPSREHWNIIKRILRYIKDTSDVILCYRGLKFTIKDYVDLYFAGDLKRRKFI